MSDETLTARAERLAAHIEVGGTEGWEVVCANTLRKERDAALARAERLAGALRPFADAVFNDNGDMTVRLVTDSDAYIAARAALATEPQS